MPTVAELDVQIDATNRASDELRKVNAQIEALEGQDATVEVETDGAGKARREIERVMVEAQALDGKKVQVTIETLLKDAERDLKKFRDTVEASQANITPVIDRGELAQDLRAMREEIERQKIILKVEADTIVAQARLEALDKVADGIKARVDVDVNDAVAHTRLAVLEKTLNSLDANIDLDLDTAALHTQLAAMRKSIDEAVEARRVQIKIDADMAAAKARLEQLDAYADTLEGKITMGMDDAIARTKLAALERALKSLDTNLDLDMDTAGVHAKIAALQAHFAALDASAKEALKGDGGGGRGRGLEDLSIAAERAGGNVRGLIAAGLLLWPALIPVMGAATAALGGFVSMATTASIGTGLFAAVAVTNYNDVTEAINKIETAQRAADVAITDTARDNALKRVAAEYANLTTSQREAVEELMDFKKEWRDFARGFEPEVFGIMANGLNLASEIFPQLGPMVQGVADALDRLIDKAREALQGPFWQSFIRMLNREAGPALDTLVTGLGNLIEGFAGVIMAFAPFQSDWNAGFIRMTESFKEWGTELGRSQGFKDFMDYARDAIPRVNKFLGALKDAIVAIVRAVAPYGDIVLSALTKVLEVITWMGKEAPLLLAVSVAFAGITAALVAVLGPITSVLRVAGLLLPLFGFLAGAIGSTAGVIAGVVVGLGALVGGLVWAYQNLDSFREAVDRAADSIVDGFNVAVDWLEREILPGIVAVGTFIKAEWDRWVLWAQGLATQFGEAWRRITTSVEVFGTILGAVWSAAWSVVSTVVEAVWPLVQQVVSGGMEAIRGAIEAVLGLITGDWTTMWNGLEGIVSGAWTAIEGINATADTTIRALFTSLKDELPTLWSEMWTALNDKADEESAAIVADLAVLKTDATTKWDEIWTAFEETASASWQIIGGIMGVGSAAFLEALEHADRGARAIWDPMWEHIKTKHSTTWALIIVDAGIALGKLKSKLDTAWAGIKVSMGTTLAQMVVLARGKFEEIRSTVATKMAETKIQSDSKWRTIASAVGPLLAPIVVTARAKFNEARTAIATALAQVVVTVREKLREAAGAVAPALGTMVRVIQGWGSSFLSAGRALLGNFVTGVRQRIGEAVSEVAMGMARIANQMPGSPAKEGPLSGQGYTKIRGQHLVEDLAAGMHRRAALVAREARDIADLMALSASPDMAFDRIAGGTFRGTRNASPGGVVMQAGAVTLQVTVGAGVDPAAARSAFDGAGEDLAERLALALSRRG